MGNNAPLKPDFTDLESLKIKMRAAATAAPVFERLAYYIAEHIPQVVFMTANELAKEVGISQGSVSRFCITLGFRGYGDFQHTLRTFIRSAPVVTQPTQYLSNLENIDEIIKNAQSDLDKLKQVFANPAYLTMLERLSAARRILLISSRISGTLLPYLSYNLKRIGKDVSIVEESDLMWETIEVMDCSQTALFTIMFPQYSHSLIFKLEHLKEKELPVMGITDSDLSPLTRLADPVLCLPLINSIPFGIYSTPMLFLSILVQDLASSTDSSKDFMERLDVVEEESYIYHKFYRFNPSYYVNRPSIPPSADK